MNTSNPLVPAATIELFQRHLMTNQLYTRKSGMTLADAVQEYTSVMEAHYTNCLECLNTFSDDAAEIQKYITEFRTLGGQMSGVAMQNGVIDGEMPADKLESVRNRAVYLVNIRLTNSILNHLQKIVKVKEGNAEPAEEAQTPIKTGLNPDSEWLYSAEEVAEYTHGLAVKSNVKSRKWREENGFPCKQSGYKSSVRYSKSEVDKWLKEHGLSEYSNPSEAIISKKARRPGC